MNFTKLLPGAFFRTLLALALGLPTANAFAQVQWVNPGTGDWNNGANWSPSPPGSGSSVEINNGGTSYLSTDTISLYTISDLGLGLMPGQAGTLELRPGATLGANNFVVVGGDGMGRIQHLAGYLGTQTMAVGAGMTGVGAYDMAGGQVDADSLFVGDMGLGSFDQQGGMVGVGLGGLSVGRTPYGVGAYNFSGTSQLLVTGPMMVGEMGLGNFDQGGGLVSVSGAPLILGFDAGASGSYHIGFGILQTDMMTFGASGAGLFTQDNGSVRTSQMSLGDLSTGAGDYALGGGSLLVQDQAVIGSQGDGSFTQTGGTANIGSYGGPVLVLGQSVDSSGTYRLEGAASQLNLAGGMIVGSEGNGTLTQQGGRLSGDFLVLGERVYGPQPGTGHYTLSGGSAQLLDMVVGFEGFGDVTQNGGSVDLDSALRLADNNSSQGTYAISGGSLDASHIYFGDGDGTMTISGTGAVTTGNIEGVGHGTLIVDGGSLTNYGDIQDIGTFILGSQAGADGEYTSMNQTGVRETFVVGDAGRGHYTQQSGYTYGPGGFPEATFVVGNQASGEGTITVQDGNFYYDELTVGNQGTGTYEQSGGSAQGGILSLGAGASGQGSLRVQSGDLEAYELHVGESGLGTVDHEGGRVEVHQALVLGDDTAANGVYNMSEGSGGPPTDLVVYNQIVLGERGVGTLNQQGGAVEMNGGILVLGDHFGSQGAYNLTGPASTSDPPARIFSSGGLVVGGFGTGVLNQGDGFSVASFQGEAILGAGPGSRGTYRLNGLSPLLPPTHFATQDRLVVGQYGTGEFQLQGAEETTMYVGRDMVLGEFSGGHGTYEMTIAQLGGGGGSPNLYVDQTLYVGAAGAGEFRQDGGWTQIDGMTIVGLSPGSTGMVEIQTPQSQLYVGGSLFVGAQGDGLFTQREGLVDAQELVLAGDPFGGGTGTGTGQYTLSGGTLHLQGGAIIGPDGTASFSQDGGQVLADSITVGPTLLGPGSSEPTYTISDGDVQVGYELNVGYEGVGTLTQTGGRISTNYFNLGYRRTGPDTSRGTYEVSGGELSVGKMHLGYDGVGEVAQTGGSVFVSSGLLLGYNAAGQGTYAISGGSLDAGYIYFGDGDGTMTISGTGAVTTGNIDGAGHGTLIVDGGSLTNYGDIQDIGTFILGSQAGADGEYTSMNQTGVRETFVVGDAGRGHYTQQSGYTYGPGGLPGATFVVGNQASGEGTISVQDGNFYYDELTVGNQGTGIYEQSGGSAQGGIFRLGMGSTGNGTVNMHGGTFQAAEAYVGQLGSAAFNQDGGSVSADYLVLGEVAGHDGTYNLSQALGAPPTQLVTDGTLLLGEEGTGTLNQDGGHVVLPNSSSKLVLGDHAGSHGTYNLTGPPTTANPPGTVGSSGMLIVGGSGTGVFNQTDGFTNVSFREGAVLGADLGSDGTYILNGSSPALPPTGFRTDSRLVVGQYGTGLFTHQGAENTSAYVQGDLVLGEFSGSQGTYEMAISEVGAGGPSYQLDVNGALFLGMAGTGVFRQNGGQSEFGSIFLGSQPTGHGSLALVDGLIETGVVVVGGFPGPPGTPSGRGEVVQEGGTLSAFGPIYIAQQSEADGTYVLSDGVLQGLQLSVGFYGQGDFTQEDGAVTVSGPASLGYRGVGQYTMHGGSLSADYLSVGIFGDGTLDQQAGAVYVNYEVGLGLAEDLGVPGLGRYHIGGGSLEAESLYIGQAGAGEFLQSGGDVLIRRDVHLGGAAQLSGNYTMTGGTFGAGEVYIGDGHTLTVSNGSRAETGAVYLAQGFGESGSIVVAGGSSWTDNSPLTLGEFGTATLEVTGGSTAMVDNQYPITMAQESPSYALVTIDGSGSQLATKDMVTISYEGAADVSITGGGKLLAGWDGASWQGSDISISHNPGSSATILVEGAGSELAAGSTLLLGTVGTAALHVSNGGSVSSGNDLGSPGDFLIADKVPGDATVTIEGFGSRVAGGDYLDIAGYGQAHVFVSDGGVLSAGRIGNPNPGIIRMAHYPGGVANVRIEDPGSTITADEVFVGGGDAGPGGSASLELRNGAAMDAAGLTIWPTGSVLVDQSTVDAEHLGMGIMAGPGNASLTIRDGTVRLLLDAYLDPSSSVLFDDGARLFADRIENEGTLRGDGTVGGWLHVWPTGTVRVMDDDYLTFTGSPGAPVAVNEGRISLVGGSIQFYDPVINEVDATISGHGALMFNQGLVNHGAVNISNDTEVYGEVINGDFGALAPYGDIVVSNDATVGFHGPVIHNGTKFQVSENANVAFFELVTGDGDFTGGGGIFFEGGYSPGNSPAWINAEPNLTYGPNSVSTMELAGPSDPEYDIVNLVNDAQLALDGTLNVDLLGGFVPDVTDRFDIFRFGSGNLSGTFSEVNLPAVMLDLGFDIFYFDTTVTLMSISFIPEPSTFALVALGLLGLAFFSRRRKR